MTKQFACLDFRNTHDFTIKPQLKALLKTNFTVEIPDGCTCMVELLPVMV